MSSSISKMSSPPKHVTISEIDEKLRKLLHGLYSAKDKISRGTKPEAYSFYCFIQYLLEKVCAEFNDVISAVNKLQAFQADIPGALRILEANVHDILADLDRNATLTDYAKQLLERNVIVLRSNIKKVRYQIPSPLQLERPYLQLSYQREHLLPNPYEAGRLISENCRFLKIFQDHYRSLEDAKKLCLLCFAIFPENAEVKKRLLKFWWIRERLTPTPAPDSDPEAKDFVNETLAQFVAMGFIEPVAKKNRLQATSYKMHPIIRSFIIGLAKEANFFDYDIKGNPIMFTSKSKKLCFLNSGTTASLSKNILKESQHRLANLENMLNVNELQTLFNINKQFPDLQAKLLSKMRNIVVLYLGSWESTAEHHREVENAEFLTGLKNMKKLRFFSLQGIAGISKLPNSLCKLTNLRVLDLRACHNLKELPDGIASLKRLAYLDLSECYMLDYIPEQLSSLSELKVLKGFVISKNSPCTLKSLAALKKLEKLSINVDNDEFSTNEVEGVFLKLKALQKLTIAWEAWNEAAAKSFKGKKASNGAKHSQRDKGEKKDKGNQESNEDKSIDNKKQENVAAKSRATTALQKLKIPWGDRREGSSKSVPENMVIATAAKPGQLVETLDDNKVGKKQGSDATKPAATNSDPNKDEKDCMKLVKLDLRCFPERELPEWLVPEKLTCLTSLYISGGALSNLGKSSMADDKKWEVKTLRLKYLTRIKTNWRELQMQFPKLKYLQKVGCPQITFCPCDAGGVWMKQP